MTKYPDALSTPSTKTHIKAAEDNLNSAKLARREIEVQKQSRSISYLSLDYIVRNKKDQKVNEYIELEIANIRAIEARKALAASRK